MHIAGFFGLMQYSSWKSKRAKLEREKREIQLANKKIPEEWPATKEPKKITYPPPRVAATPTPTPVIAMQKKKPIHEIAVINPPKKQTVILKSLPTPQAPNEVQSIQRNIPVITKQKANEITERYNDLLQKIEGLNYTTLTEDLCKEFVNKGKLLAQMQTNHNFNEEVFEQLSKDFERTKQILLRALEFENQNKM